VHAPAVEVDVSQPNRSCFRDTQTRFQQQGEEEAFRPWEVQAEQLVQIRRADWHGFPRRPLAQGFWNLQDGPVLHCSNFLSPPNGRPEPRQLVVDRLASCNSMLQVLLAKLIELGWICEAGQVDRLPKGLDVPLLPLDPSWSIPDFFAVGQVASEQGIPRDLHWSLFDTVLDDIFYNRIIRFLHAS
jgi:hypothetical protein